MDLVQSRPLFEQKSEVFASVLCQSISNDLIFTRQIDPAISFHFWDQIMDGSLQAYQVINPLNQERIKVCRVAHLFGFLPLGLAGFGTEFMRKPESPRKSLCFIGQTTGLRLSSP